MAFDDLWYKDAVFYEVYVRAFFDSNGDGNGDLRGITEKLDYLKWLGIDCLWLLPIYSSPLRDDGYDISDYRGILPAYGQIDDFKTLVEQAHRRDMRVIADLVLNHTSDQHPWFQAARADRNSPFHNYYVWSDSDQKYKDARIIFVDTEKSNWSWDASAGQYYWHRFYFHQPDLNYDNPAVRAEMLAVMKYWLDLGIDGFRADAVPYLFEREGTNCENLPETHAYLKEIRRFTDEHYPGRILLAEANQWPEDVRSYFGANDEFNMAFHFPVMPRLFMALRQGDSTPIAKILARTPPIPPECQWCIFLRNHDELTLEMVTEEERQWMWQQYAPDPRMRLNLGIRRRLAPLLDNDRRKLELANSLLFTLPGSPILYYGDEIGMGDNIALPDRDGVRTPMQWEDSLNAGFSTTAPDKLYLPVIATPPYDPSSINVKAQQQDPGSLLNRVRHMLAVRKANPVFARGDFKWLDEANTATAVYLRLLGEQRVLVVQNLSVAVQTVHLELGSDQPTLMRDLLSGETSKLSLSGEIDLTLEPYEYHWYTF